ncbi:MAG: hypothetical protein AB7K52_12170 [Phycisphaerales bacterium]
MFLKSHAVSALSLIVAAGLASTAAAQTRLSVGQQGAKGAGVRSFVCDAASSLVATDARFASDVATYWPGAKVAVDVVMQQCHGGGFGPDLEALAGRGGSIPNLTFTSAAAFDETARNQEGHAFAGFGAINYLDNFTRAWVDDVRLNRTNRAFPGMYQHARAAAFGRRAEMNPLTNLQVIAAVKADPFGPFGAIRKNAEHPQYYSPDRQVPENLDRDWPNNLRSFHRGASAAPRYAILVAWDTPDERHGVNINRVYRTLRDQYRIPADNIAVLYGNSAAGSRLPLRTTIGPSNQDLSSNAGIYIDGPNTRAEWINALKGDVFPTRPGKDARLFIYSTGHGGLDEEGVLSAKHGAGFLSVEFPDHSIDESPVDALDQDGGRVAPLADAEGMVLVQFSTRRPLSGSVQVELERGIAPAPLAPAAPQRVLSLDGLITPYSTSDLLHYHVRVPKGMFDASTPGTVMRLVGPGFTGFEQGLVVAVTVKAGEQRYSATVEGAICAADYTRDGALDADDLGAFINDYFAAPALAGPGGYSHDIDGETWSPVCDVNADGVLNADDLGDFINLYFGGC